ncbi:Uncharacterised protein [uncultured archaeon]|nr:Uncharacterised protein [uncultured archaeon]
MKKILALSLVFILLGSFMVLAERENNSESNLTIQTGCTKEAKICPDGTTVAREGSDCEFAKCPEQEYGCSLVDVCDQGVCKNVTRCTEPPRSNKTEDKWKSDEVESELNVTEEIDNENKTVVKAHFSNGKESEIKVMPETASARAIERLKLKVCSEENNCTIVLKEVGQGNETRAMYLVSAEKDSKVIGLFNAKMHVEAEIDAETGNVTKENKPWWAFLASQ